MLHCIPATHTNHQYYNHRHTRDTSWTTDAVPGVPKGREPVCGGGEIKDIKALRYIIYPFIKISTLYNLLDDCTYTKI